MIRRPKTTASSGASRRPTRPTRPGRNNRRSRGHGTMNHRGHFEKERNVQTPDTTPGRRRRRVPLSASWTRPGWCCGYRREVVVLRADQMIVAG